MGSDDETGRRLASRAAYPSSLARAALRRQTPKVGAGCSNRARPDLCGGCPVMGIPTAILQQSWPFAAVVAKGSFGSRWRRAEQDNAHYALPRRGEPAIAGRGNRPGIDVTGMRRDQRLRYGSNRRGHGAAEEVIDLASELGGVRRVERSSDRGGTDSGQGGAPQQDAA